MSIESMIIIVSQVIHRGRSPISQLFGIGDLKKSNSSDIFAPDLFSKPRNDDQGT